MNTLGSNKRLGWIDYARGIAIILVVYRHVFEGLKNAFLSLSNTETINSYLILEKANIFFFSFRMPLFFLVSGLFIGASLRKRGFYGILSNKFKTILYPYLVWGFVQITIQIIFSRFTNSNKNWVDYTYLFYLPREVEQFWYLLALFNVTILYAAVRFYLRISIYQQIGIGLALFLLSSHFSVNNIEWGFVSDIFHYYIYFALGDAASSELLTGKFKAFLSKGISLLILLIPFVLAQTYFLLTNLNNNDVAGKYLFVEYHQPAIFLLISLVGVFFIISLSMQLEKRTVAGWLRYLGEHSLYIYVLHVIVFAAARVFLIRVLNITNIPILQIICMVAGLVFPIIIYEISKKYGLTFLFSLEGLRNQRLISKSAS